MGTPSTFIPDFATGRVLESVSCIKYAVGQDKGEIVGEGIIIQTREEDLGFVRIEV